MTVRLLGLNCSPRDKNNSGIMIGHAFEKLAATYPGQFEHEVVHLRELHVEPVSYTHLRAHETPEHLVCRLLLDKTQILLIKIIFQTDTPLTNISQTHPT